MSIDAVCSQTDLLHQGGLSWVSIASHVNTTDSKKHLGTNRSLYHSSSRKGSFEVGGGMLEGEKAKALHDDRRWPVGGSIDADLRLERRGERAVETAVQGSRKEVSQSLKNGFTYFILHT